MNDDIINMLSAVLQKMRLVDTNGLMLAEFPEEADFIKSQLAGGIMSALMTYSKQIHNKDLQSVNMEERKIFFIPSHEFIIILETNLDTQEDLIMGILEEVKEKADLLLGGSSADTLKLDQAKLIITELALIFQRFELLHDMADMVDEITINDAVLVNYSYKIPIDKSKGTKDKYESDILEFINKNEISEFIDTEFEIFMLHLISSNSTGIFIATIEDDILDIGGLIVDDTEIDKIACMFETIRDQVKTMLTTKLLTDKKLLLESIENTVSVNRYNLPDTMKENISLVALRRLVIEPDMLITAAITGYPIIVHGDQILVKIIVSTLAVFTQHKATIIEFWSDISHMGQFHIIGCDKLDEEPQNTLICNVNTGRISGEISSCGYFHHAHSKYHTLRDNLSKIKEELLNCTRLAIKSTHPSAEVDIKLELIDTVNQIKKTINPFL